MSHKRPLGDKDIVFALHDSADSENNLDFDNDGLADSDFVPKMEIFEDDT